MSISRCPHCEENYDQDTDVEHEEICKDEHSPKFDDIPMFKESKVFWNEMLLGADKVIKGAK
jgi:hypothetical protein